MKLWLAWYRVWNFTYAEYLKVFQEAARELGVQVVPYQARQSGPSIDRANRRRDLNEVQKRGGWMTRKTVQRYEKAGLPGSIRDRRSRAP